MEEMEERRFKKMLETTFTDEEKVQMSKQIGIALRSLKKAQDDLATVKAQFTSKIKEHEAEVNTLMEKINSGWEMRSVSCREVKDYNTGSVFIFRDDTHEMIEERAMTGEERQPPLPLLGQDKEETTTDHPAAGDGASPGETVFNATEEPAKEEAAILGADKPLNELPDDANPFYVGKPAGEEH